MKKSTLFPFAALKLGFLVMIQSLSPTVSAMELYRYTDSEGVIHMSNTLSTEAVSQGYSVINHQGRTINQVSPKSIGLNKAARLQRESEEEKRLIEKKLKDDLLNRYTSIADARNAKARKVAEITTQILYKLEEAEALKVKRAQIMEKLEASGSGAEQATLMSEQLATVDLEINKTEAYITQKEEEKEIQSLEYDKDIAMLKLYLVGPEAEQVDDT